MSFQKKIPQLMGFAYQEDCGCYYREISSYPLVLFPGANSQFYLLTCVKQGEEMPDAAKMKEALTAEKSILNLDAQGYRISCLFRSGITEDKTIANLKDGVEALLSYLEENGYIACCEFSGSEEKPIVCYGLDAIRFLSEEDYHDLEKETANRSAQADGIKENVPLGILGALLGSSVGVAAILLFSRIGLISALSGVIMGFCAMKGYELLGRKLSRKGVIISLVFMILMCVLANKLDWSIEIAKELKWRFGYAFENCEYVLRQMELMGRYYLNLAEVIGFTLLGAAPTMISAFKQQSRPTGVIRLS